jgi:DNA-directed RNA polymerase III subunit RPC1
MQLWTGKQIIGMLLRPNNDGEWPLVNLELQERHFEAPKGAPLYMCPRDGYVVFRNSEVHIYRSSYNLGANN